MSALDQAIEQVMDVYESHMQHAPCQDVLEAWLAWNLAQELKKLRWRFDSVTQGHKRKGRHARSATRADDFALDLECYERCHELRAEEKSWEKTYERVGREVNLGVDAVKAKRFKVEHALKNPAFLAKAKRLAKGTFD